MDTKLKNRHKLAIFFIMITILIPSLAMMTGYFGWYQMKTETKTKAFKNAEKSENYKEKVKKYLNNNEKNITYYIDIVKNNKSEKTKWFEMLSYLLKKNADIIVIKSIEQFSNLFNLSAQYYIEYFRKNKSRVYFLDDNIDILNEEEYMQATFKLIFLECMKFENDKRSIKGQCLRNKEIVVEESENIDCKRYISERIKWGKEMSKRQKGGKK